MLRDTSACWNVCRLPYNKSDPSKIAPQLPSINGIYLAPDLLLLSMGPITHLDEVIPELSVTGFILRHNLTKNLK